MTVKFSKTRIANSDRYKSKQDIVNAILKDDELYTIAEVDSALEAFYGRGKLKMKTEILLLRKTMGILRKRARSISSR